MRTPFIILFVLSLSGCAYPRPVVWAHEDKHYGTLQKDTAFCKMMAEEFSFDTRLPVAANSAIGGAVGAGMGYTLASVLQASANGGSDEGIVLVAAIIGVIAGGTLAYNRVYGNNVGYYKTCIINGTSKTNPHLVKGWKGL